MKENQFPNGWDEERVKRVIAHYEAQTEDEAVVEDESEDKSMIKTKDPARYHIIESDLGPLISESRMTVYDVLEAQNNGQTLYEISMNRNLTPSQVQVAFDYIEQHRERLQVELDEILRKAAERKKHYDSVAEEIRKKIAQKPMTPERAKLQELIAKNRAHRKENKE